MFLFSVAPAADLQLRPNLNLGPIHGLLLAFFHSHTCRLQL